MRLSIASISAGLLLLLQPALSTYDDDHLPPGGAAGNFVSFWYGFVDGVLPDDVREYRYYPYIDGGAHCCEVPTKIGNRPITDKINTTGSIECKFFENPKCNADKGHHSKTWEKQGVRHSAGGYNPAAYACRLPFASEEIKPAAADYVKEQYL